MLVQNLCICSFLLVPNLVDCIEAVEWLETETVIRVGQNFRSLGGSGVSPQILSECYDRMAVWVRLAQETLEAEWPTFEAIRAFSVFQLQPRLSPHVVKKDLAKITQIFNEPNSTQALLRSYVDCEYTASRRRVLDSHTVCGCLPL